VGEGWDLAVFSKEEPFLRFLNMRERTEEKKKMQGSEWRRRRSIDKEEINRGRWERNKALQGI